MTPEIVTLPPATKLTRRQTLAHAALAGLQRDADRAIAEAWAALVHAYASAQLRALAGKEATR